MTADTGNIKEVAVWGVLCYKARRLEDPPRRALDTPKVMVECALKETALRIAAAAQREVPQECRHHKHIIRAVRVTVALALIEPTEGVFYTSLS